jgi:hypothetical protein
MKKTINAKIIADSVSPQGHRITSYILTYPRFIHGELMTHRMFSRNAASSRAIPFEKMVKDIEEDPFTPIAWQKNHKGMQGVEYNNSFDSNFLTAHWLRAKVDAVHHAKILHGNEATKQLCNRLLEPFQWMTTLVTATEYDNFFELRCPKYGDKIFKYFSKKDFIKYNSDADENIPDSWWREWNSSQAEIHIQALAESMWDAKNESEPKNLKAGEWHVPDFGYKGDGFLDYCADNNKDPEKIQLQMSTAHCAKLSFNNHGKGVSIEKDINLYNKLLNADPIHASPFEHCARAMSDEEYYSLLKGEYPTGFDKNGDIFNYEIYAKVNKDDKFMNFIGENPNMAEKQIYGWCNNFRGFIQYRYLIENAK